MSITFATEAWGTAWKASEPLWLKHWEEVGRDKERMPLDPDLLKCQKLADCGALHIMVGRDAGRVVSYYAAVVDTLLHYRTVLAANVDLYYILPEYRRGRNALRMFQAAEALLKARGVKVIYDATKLTADHSKLFEYLGYTFSEKRYSKWIGD